MQGRGLISQGFDLDIGQRKQEQEDSCDNIQ